MKNLFKYFLISFGIHSFIMFIFLFEKEFSKPKTDILEVEILPNNGRKNKVLTKQKKTTEKNIYKTFGNTRNLDNTHNFTGNKSSIPKI